MSATALEFVPSTLLVYYVAPIDNNMLYGFTRHATDMKWTITTVSDLLATVAHNSMCYQVLGMQFSSVDMLVNMMSVIISTYYPSHVDNEPLSNMYLSPVYNIPDRLFVEELHRIPADPKDVTSRLMKSRLMSKGWISPKDVRGDLLISAFTTCHVADLYRIYIAHLERIRKCVSIVAPIMPLIKPKM